VLLSWFPQHRKQCMEYDSCICLPKALTLWGLNVRRGSGRRPVPRPVGQSRSNPPIHNLTTILRRRQTHAPNLDFTPYISRVYYPHHNSYFIMSLVFALTRTILGEFSFILFDVSDSFSLALLVFVAVSKTIDSFVNRKRRQ
jgi:hypothetical protein